MSSHLSSRLSSIKSLVVEHVSLFEHLGLRDAFSALRPKPQKRATYVTIFVLATGLFGGAGCAPVAPYERGKLAHPTMTAGDLAGFGESHLRAITEGAIGAAAVPVAVAAVTDLDLQVEPLGPRVA